MKPTNKIEVIDIFNLYYDEFLRKFGSNISANQKEALRDISICRTSELGGHIEVCDHCGTVRISYNSCRNRHCPKCQNVPALEWLMERKKDLLPIQYFHLVFTVPDKLNDLFYSNQSICYNLLFKAVSKTILSLTRNTKKTRKKRVYLGAETGVTTILHSWGQKLLFHPHIHCLLSGGGLSFDGKQWISSNKHFIIPVRVLSKIFKCKLLSYIKSAYRDKKLKFPKSLAYLEDSICFDKFIKSLYNLKWVVYSKSPPENCKPETILDYFGRYTYKVAISNYRIIKLENDKVYFYYKDYRDNSKTKIMALSALEFIRRFLLHILPKRFVKIRYYGFLSNSHREDKIKIIRALLGVNTNDNLKEGDESMQDKSEDIIFAATGIDINKCPVCKIGRFVINNIIPPNNNKKSAGIYPSGFINTG